MKTKNYQPRFYRFFYSSKFYKQEIIVKESDIVILSEKKIEKQTVRKIVVNYRKQIESYIQKHKIFSTSLKPLPINYDAPNIIKEMMVASSRAGVGPMAAVAGAISEYVGRELLKNNKEIIIENGGDIFLKAARDIRIGVYAGNSILSNKIFVNVHKDQMPLGVCASSGTVGHSLSFGKADTVVITSNSSILSDAVATATANRVKSKKDFKKAINFAKSIKGIKGILIILEKDLGIWGNLEIFS